MSLKSACLSPLPGWYTTQCDSEAEHAQLLRMLHYEAGHLRRFSVSGGPVCVEVWMPSLY